MTTNIGYDDKYPPGQYKELSTLSADQNKGLTNQQNPATVTALDIQIDGSHYKELPIQPVEYIHANKIGYFEGNVIKYVTRWKTKNGVADLRKAAHYIQLLIELEEKTDLL